jgi:hypothetical protein
MLNQVRLVAVRLGLGSLACFADQLDCFIIGEGVRLGSFIFHSGLHLVIGLLWDRKKLNPLTK